MFSLHNTHQKSNCQTLFLYSEKQLSEKQQQVRNFAWHRNWYWTAESGWIAIRKPDHVQHWYSIHVQPSSKIFWYSRSKTERSPKKTIKCRFLTKKCRNSFPSDVPESFLSSQSHLKLFRNESWLGRVTRTVESLRIIVLQARINVESHEIPHFSMTFFMLWNGAQLSINLPPIS